LAWTRGSRAKLERVLYTRSKIDAIGKGAAKDKNGGKELRTIELGKGPRNGQLAYGGLLNKRPPGRLTEEWKKKKAGLWVRGAGRLAVIGGRKLR